MEINRCPFCGSGKVGINNTDEKDRYKWVMCLKCGADGPIDKLEEEAIRKWNERKG